MRTFHVGGTVSIKQESQIITKSKNFKNTHYNLIEDSKKSNCHGKEYTVITGR